MGELERVARAERENKHGIVRDSRSFFTLYIKMLLWLSISMGSAVGANASSTYIQAFIFQLCLPL